MASCPKLPLGERVYAIGDVHGHADLLAELLDLIRLDNAARPKSRVRIILVGDLIDRGPSSADLVARCRDLTCRHDCFIVLKGNHEAMMVDALRGSVPAFTFWLGQGGNAALASWGVSVVLANKVPSRELMAAAEAQVPREAVAWLARLPLYHRCGNCLFVHAGIRPGVRLAKQKAVDLLWIRSDFIGNTDTLPYFVVHGHTIDETGPRLHHGRLGIDTGAYRTGRLTAVGIEGDELWSLSTGPKSVSSGRRHSIEESVDAVVGGRSDRAPSAPRSAIPMRALTTVFAAATAVLLVGTITSIQSHGGPPAVALSTADSPVPRPVKKKISRQGDAAASPTALPSLSAAVMERVPIADVSRHGGGNRVSYVDRTSYRSSTTERSSSPVRHGADRLLSTPPAARNSNPLASRTKVPLDSIGGPVSVVTLALADRPAAASASAVRPIDGALLSPDPMPPAASTPSRRQSETAKERVRAIDAIRLLRRQ